MIRVTCMLQALYEEEYFKPPRGSPSNTGTKHLDSFVLLYPLVVQNLLPLGVRLREKRRGEERTIRPGELVHFSGVNLDVHPTFEANVCICICMGLYTVVIPHFDEQLYLLSISSPICLQHFTVIGRVCHTISP